MTKDELLAIVERAGPFMVKGAVEHAIRDRGALLDLLREMHRRQRTLLEALR